ncbi:hypothetical protein L208DRAFT_1419003, partial [Tricholoma matsutake]
MPRAISGKNAIDDSPHRHEDYMFFWTTSHVNGWASQWYPAPFTAQITISEVDETHQFPTTEHWMMLQKALLFNDFEVARNVLDVTSTGKQAMSNVKALGRKVKNFEDVVWKRRREQIVLEGNLLKFRQNRELKEKLLGTGEKMIVEASPRDRIWGIGFGEKNALERFDSWGLNLLGKTLVQVRKMLREEGASGQDVDVNVAD